MDTFHAVFYLCCGQNLLLKRRKYCMAKNNLQWIGVNSNDSVMDYFTLTNDKINDPAKRLQWEQSWRAKIKPNYAFEENLKFIGFGSKRASLEGPDGKHYSMFLGEFERLLKEGRLNGLYIRGKWTYAKRGPAVGLVEDKYGTFDNQQADSAS